jgi:hypothetical protein
MNIMRADPLSSNEVGNKSLPIVKHPDAPGVHLARIDDMRRAVKVKDINGELFAIVGSTAVPVADLDWIDPA